MPKLDWYKGSSYVYTPTPQDGKTTISFHFPNASGGSLEFTTWLYKFKSTGDIPFKYEKIDTNLAAEMLQCYIDLEELKSDPKPTDSPS